MLETPILFIVFNRPETTRLVFQKIREAQPSRLFIAFDGPRASKNGEASLCQEVKNIVAKVDWPCELHQLNRTENLGCKIAVSSAIHWFFNHVEKGIILEDDCLPSDSFFTFCESMLTIYSHDSSIMHISGNNFQDEQIRSTNSHYFSKYAHIWGWATWRRSWKHYELEMQSFPKWEKDPTLSKWFSSKDEMKFWLKKFRFHYKNPSKTTTWDYQWLFSVWLNRGLSVIPEVNLVKNIGIGSGTHTTKVIGRLIIEAKELNIPTNKIIDPIINNEADRYTFKNYFAYKGNLMDRIAYRINKLIQ